MAKRNKPRLTKKKKERVGKDRGRPSDKTFPTEAYVSSIKTVTLPNGQPVQAQEVEFNLIKEDWSQYQIPDGTIVKLRTTVLKILQVLDEKGKPAKTPDGDPLLIVNHKVDVITSG